MGRHERIDRLRAMLDGGQVVSRSRLERELEVSASTFKRDMEALRNEGVPVTYDPERGGYRLDLSTPNGARYERLTVWANPDEVHALLAMQRLMAGIDPGGLLDAAVEPLRPRMNALLAQGVPKGSDVTQRIRILGMATRPVKLPHFKTLSTALLRRKQVRMSYTGRSRNETSQRTVCPQRLVHYRDNWYLDAWCHQRKALRTFAVDAVQDAQMLGTAAADIAEETLDAALGAGYGIFAGANLRWAKLRFNSERARWVAFEQWHPDQRSMMDDEGRYVLEVPYSQPTELVMDVMRHLPDVEVLSPAELDREVRLRVKQALVRWGG
jgi:predicted DNA-binding transcriptional regulator YafY